jgi:two-component system LytT family sensor kinase
MIDKPIQKQLLYLLSLLFGGAILQSALQIFIAQFLSLQNDEIKFTFSIAVVYFINWILIYIIWLMLYVFYQFVERQRTKFIHELKLIALRNEIELNNLRTQLNPHFMFNSMNSIRALIDENPTIAKTAVTKLSTLLRSTLQFSKRNFIDFKEELELVKDYLFLEKMRFEERLEFEFDIDAGLNDVKFPPLMLQTLVENAIKHGISKLPKGGSVTIMATKDSEFYLISVINSGMLNKGEESYPGIGLLNTVKRIRLLYGKKATIDLSEKEGKVYTELKIPIKPEIVMTKQSLS